MTWILDYSDGAANAYHVRPEGDGARFEYDPVTPERSSTGRYSGGDPRRGRLDAPTLAQLWRLVRELEANTSLHVEDRGKGTGLFHITEGSEQRSFIIARGPELLAFDAFVGAL